MLPTPHTVGVAICPTHALRLFTFVVRTICCRYRFVCYTLPSLHTWCFVVTVVTTVTLLDTAVTHVCTFRFPVLACLYTYCLTTRFPTTRWLLPFAHTHVGFYPTLLHPRQYSPFVLPCSGCGWCWWLYTRYRLRFAYTTFTVPVAPRAYPTVGVATPLFPRWLPTLTLPLLWLPIYPRFCPHTLPSEHIATYCLVCCLRLPFIWIWLFKLFGFI